MVLPIGWYPGPWHVCEEDSLEKRPRLSQGEMLIHKNGSILLNCPACNALQFARVEVIGDKKKPTIRGVVHCGAGHCKRCGVWFSVSGGRTTQETEPVKKSVVISTKLKVAGVKRPSIIDRS